MSNQLFGSLDSTTMNSSDYAAKRRQQQLYRNAAQETSGFGIATTTSGVKTVVTARSYADLFSLTKGWYHTDSSGAETLTNDIWAGNKMQVKYESRVPVMATENTVINEGQIILEPTVPRTGKANVIPYPNTIEYGFPGFAVDPSGSLFDEGELGAGPAWVKNIADVSYNNTADYKRAASTQPFQNFRFPHRVTLS